MLNENRVERIGKNPIFRELVAQRSRLVWLLLGVALLAYFALTTLVAFWPAVLRMPLAQGMATTVGVAVAIAVMVLGWVLACIYVIQANGRFDAITERLLCEEQI